MSPVVPRALVWGPNVISGGYGIIVNTDGSLTLPSPVTGFTTHAAKAGDTLYDLLCELVLAQHHALLAVTGAAATSMPLEADPECDRIVRRPF